MGSLELKIPWANLKTQPVRVLIGDFYVLAGPLSEAEVIIHISSFIHHVFFPNVCSMTGNWRRRRFSKLNKNYLKLPSYLEVQLPLQKLLKGLPLLGPLVSGPPVGIGILSAGVILAIMIIPFISSVIRDVFEVTPPLLKESAYGLGATTWEVVSKVVLPYTKAGVVGGIMLGLGRALGETMAVTFVIGNINQLNSISLFSAANSITSVLASEFAEASEGLHKASLIYLGLVLFFITFVVLSLSKFMLAQLRKSEGTKS